MRTAYFHIGTSKTGSSALQSFLTHNYSLRHPTAGKHFLYCCLSTSGQIAFGEDLKTRAQNSDLGYVSSRPNAALSADLSITKHYLDQIFAAGLTPVFSQESWADEARHFAAQDFFTALDIRARVIIYVRPQIDWFNSAWWQWFAWEQAFEKPEDVLQAWGYSFLRWQEKIAQWQTIPGVEEVSVRLHSPDIITDFCSFLGLSAPAAESRPRTTNRSLPPTLIKLLLKFPELRRAHDSYVDTILANTFNFEGASPWVMDPALITQIQEATRADNIILSTLLSEADQKRMLADSRWWRADHYQEREVFNPQTSQLTPQEMSSLLEQAIPALLKSAQK